jgi:hypothetical protein
VNLKGSSLYSEKPCTLFFGCKMAGRRELKKGGIGEMKGEADAKCFVPNFSPLSLCGSSYFKDCIFEDAHTCLMCLLKHAALSVDF